MTAKRKSTPSRAKKASPRSTKSTRSPKKVSEQGDIITLILKDHAPLKKLIKIMKNSDKDLSERQDAFEQFCPLLVAHAKSEEQVLYAHLKEQDDLREEALEGDVEHGLADQMVEEAMRTDDEDLWSARVKVLAELVEHHIEEEEEELLPDFRKNSEREERVELGEEYLAAKENINGNGTEKNPSRVPGERSVSH